jgi:hypothetical protein
MGTASEPALSEVEWVPKAAIISAALAAEVSFSSDCGLLHSCA